jgi:hypothetical protein
MHIVVDGLKYELREDVINDSRVAFVDAEPLVDTGEVHRHLKGRAIVCACSRQEEAVEGTGVYKIRL